MNLQEEIELAVFDAASRIEGSEARRAFVNWAYRDAPEEAQRMNEVLGGEAQAQDWIQSVADSLTGLAAEVTETGSIELPDQALESGELSDLSQSLAERYTIFETIGAGSGGYVYLAEQLQPVRRRVAIKLLRSGLESPQFLAAFQRERQILATMNHPNIAAILDAGTTTSGRPFLVMELVEGQRITEYCNVQRLDLRQRLELFLQVCSAIQHAHLKSIIHLDIKPSNILVAHANSQPLPKVIDFGIANAGEWSKESSAVSGTPAYMSPEQADPGRWDIDTRSDCFSLGVVLFELLAGSPPWTPQRLCLPPPLASSRAATLPTRSLEALAAARRLSPREWISRLQGDLDAIIAKAIALDRERRYESVDRLAGDIRRHLDRFPVSARRATRSYVAQCFLARNRLACLAGITVLVALLLATGISVTFFLREHRARGDAERSQARVTGFLNDAIIRENVARVAILLSQDRNKEAEDLLLQHPIASISPSAEAAYVFRFLGERFAVCGKWQEAAECFERLMKSNQLTPARKLAQSLDLLYSGAAVLEARETRIYEEIRQDMLRRLEKTTDQFAAEHMLKFCLLTQPPWSAMEILRPMAELLRANDSQNGWFILAIAMFDLRDGKHSAAFDGAARGSNLRVAQSCRACLKLVLSMSAQSLGKPDIARRELDEASDMIKEVQSLVIVKNYEDYVSRAGTWHAWAVARILQREASARRGR